jgi:ketosteroid isomerase-like protein
MSEEPTTPDPVELTRHVIESVARRDFDAAVNFLAPDAVWVGRELFTFEGPAAIRSLWEDWVGAYEEFEVEFEELLDLGNGVVFAVLRQGGRPAGSRGHVRERYACVGVWVEGVIRRVTNYPDTNIDEARAAAKRLA